MDKWRDRIVGLKRVDPAQLLANPANWRIHPHRQEEALQAALDGVGWVSPIIVNKTTDLVVDGHLRAAMAISHNEKRVPVLLVELSPEEEAATLATFDPITSMAATDAEKLDQLLRDIPNMTPEMDALLAEVAAGAGLYLTPPEGEGSQATKAALAFLTWGDQRVPLSADESQALTAKLEDHREEKGTEYGFVGALLAL